MGERCGPRLTEALFCPQIMSVLLFIEHSVEVAHGKASCRFSQAGYLRIGRSKGQGGEGGRGPWLGVGRLGFEALPLPLFEPQISQLHLSRPGSRGWEQRGWCLERTWQDSPAYTR